MDQRGVQRRKGKVERPSWRRWALSQTSEDESSQAARKRGALPGTLQAGSREGDYLEGVGFAQRASFLCPINSGIL